MTTNRTTLFKKLLLASLLSGICTVSFAQKDYKKVYKYDDFNPGWALVKTISGTYGFIDREGKDIVPPIYAKINKFEYENGRFALVKNISGAYGFIDRNGEVVVPVIYWSKEEAIQKLKISTKD